MVIPSPLSDVRRAIRILRASAGTLRLAPGRIGIPGFSISASGHLAGYVATMLDPQKRS